MTDRPAQRQTMKADLFQPEAIEPIRLFEALRVFVLERSHNRLPHWRFRLADDLVLYVQPRPAERRDRYYAFLGEAFGTEDGAALTREACDAGSNLWRLRFGIGLDWVVKPRCAWWPSSTRPRDYPGAIAFRSRVLAALRSGAFNRLSAPMMLSPQCLCCGKRLTDPISAARWIGPECAGYAGSERRLWRLLCSEAPDRPAPKIAASGQSEPVGQLGLDLGPDPVENPFA